MTRGFVLTRTTDCSDRRENIALLVVFGSALTDAPDPGDVDLAVWFDRGGSSDVLALFNGLYQLTGYEGYDVLDLGHAGPVAKERALVGTEVLYEARPGLFANLQIAAIMERMDTAAFRQLDLELMAE